MKTHKSTAEGISPRSRIAPPAEHRFQKGRSGNPKGRPNIGLSIMENLNTLGHRTVAEIRRAARDPKAPCAKRIAAALLVAAAAPSDMADFEPYLTGKKTLPQLRRAGVDTSVVKRARSRTFPDKDGGTTTVRKIELHSRAGETFDQVMDRTVGKPKMQTEISGMGSQSTQINVVYDDQIVISKAMLAQADEEIRKRLTHESGQVEKA